MPPRHPALRACRVAILLAATASAGCEDDAPAARAVRGSASVAASPAGSAPWPALPDNQVTLGALVDRATRRGIGELPPLSGRAVIGALEASIRNGTLAGGWSDMVETLTRTIETASRRGKRTWLLVGSHHDAPDQVDAYRRMVGPLGLTPAPLAAVEQLQGDGAWAGLALGEQLGDDALVRRYLKNGDAQSLAQLRAQQRDRNYTAWKYAYVERVVDVVVGARAAGRPLVGCDMPGPMQVRLAETVGDEAAILRDLHCALAIQRHLDAAPRATVAVFVGDAHLAPSKLPRFIPATDAVVRIHLLGGRDGGATVEGLEALRVIEPILIPLGARRFAMVLDGAPHDARVDRVRIKDASRSGGDPQITVLGASGSLRLGLANVALGEGTFSQPQPPGPVGFLLDTAQGGEPRLVTGTLDVPPGGSITLDLQEAGVVRIERREP